jgi:O-acetyl-ADP-ribose deacetylase (regulator of RNase III)
MTSRAANHEECEELQRVLLALHSMIGEDPGERHPTALRRSLTAWLTVHRTSDIPQEAWPLLDWLWGCESSRKAYTCASDLDRLSSDGSWTDHVSLWRGDITQLQADAIVNAANSGLTGCYVPFHACIDNAIHTAAGPWLRRECERIMALRGRPEPTGTATGTPAFYLPARHVFHTVGPIVKAGNPTREDDALLRQCYLACLDAVWQLELKSVAFCAISTGVFGYPKRDAAACSLSAIRNHLAANPDPPHVVLVAFTQEDELVYREAVGLLCR